MATHVYRTEIVAGLQLKTVGAWRIDSIELEPVPGGWQAAYPTYHPQSKRLRAAGIEPATVFRTLREAAEAIAIVLGVSNRRRLVRRFYLVAGHDILIIPYGQPERWRTTANGFEGPYPTRLAAAEAIALHMEGESK